jgi:hypothetical protein
MLDSQNRLLTRAVQKVFPNRDRQGAASVIRFIADPRG